MANTSRARQGSKPSAPAPRPAGNLNARLLAIAVVIAALVAGIAYWLTSRNDDAATSGTVRVGGDLHALAWMGDKLYVGGHQGAGALTNGAWAQIDTLDDIDAMSFGSTGSSIFAGGHAGLFVSTDGGVTFAPASTDLPVTDIHALGAESKVVYLASPQAGTFRSTDGGKTFTRVSSTGQSFMGNIEIDPANPDHALAPDMMSGVAETTDGGTTWHALGGPGGSMAVAWDPTDPTDIVALGMNGAQRSSDGGKTWTDLILPSGATAAAFGRDGRLYAAVLKSDHAEVFEQSGDSWTPVPQPRNTASTQ